MIKSSMDMDGTHTHLSQNEMVNFGVYYTPSKLVDIAYDLLKKNIKNFESYTLLDNSCGYGEFLKFDVSNRKVGADIDDEAVKNLKISQKYVVNALNKPNRSNYDIGIDEKLIMVGNPPYNDITSQIKKNVKKQEFIIDDELKVRDIGISFLRSYVKLLPDYICVLHPLSYLVKLANFNLLKDFKAHYRLIDGLVVSSSYFKKGMEFPIIIAFYEKGSMNFEHIRDFVFEIENGEKLRLGAFDFIGNYLNKYPRKSVENPVGYFYTMRDINALKRNKTFLKEKSRNAVAIEKGQLPYYYYVHLFKLYSKDIPFWCGSLDVFIDNNFFTQHIDEFIESSKSGKISKVVDDYFKRILCYK